MEKRVAVLFAFGTEEIEAITPIDLLRRAGAKVDIIGVGGEFLTGSHSITIKADKLVCEVCADGYDAVVIPGGMPGATNIAGDKDAMKLIQGVAKRDKLVASICASPAVVLANNNLIGCKKATCYPASQFINALKENYQESDVVVSENLITANGPKSAFKFALEIIKYLGLNIQF